MISDVLDRLGIEYEEKHNELIAPCPMHEVRTGKADGNPSWSVNATTGVFHCFSCNWNGTMTTLVRDVLGLEDLVAARNWIGAGEAPAPANVLRTRVARLAPVRIPLIDTGVEEAEYLAHPEPSEDMIASRQVSADACRRYGVRAKNGAWLFPIRDDGGKLIGWQSKAHDGVRNYPPGVPKSLTLFGLDTVTSDTVVVVESPLDAVLASMAGYDAVATFGASVADYQIRLLASFQPVLAMDSDEAGKRATQRMSTALAKRGVWTRQVVWPEGIKDFGDDPALIPALVEGARSPLAVRMHV